MIAAGSSKRARRRQPAEPAGDGAVNEASRVESLQKTIGRSILITGAAARLIDAPLDFVGDHALRGVAAPVAI